VIQSTKGSFARVNVVYTDLEEFLSQNKAVNIGTDMVGESIYQFNFPENLI
jgi:TrmH family RNA methyltransferase